MTNILQNIDLRVECHQCDHDYDIPLATIAECQSLLQEGCPGSIYECPPAYYATLIDPSVLHNLAVAWQQVEQAANRNADGIVYRGHLSIELISSESQQG